MYKILNPEVTLKNLAISVISSQADAFLCNVSNPTQDYKVKPSTNTVETVSHAA
jgi:hypothetical protein